MNYAGYTELDFATDDYFIQWVRFPDETTNAFWRQWLADNPGKKQQVETARRLVLSVELQQHEWAQEDELKLKEKILAAMTSRPAAPARVVRFRKQYWLAAAVMAGIILIATFLWTVVFPGNTEYATHYGEIKEYVLPDGSTVMLNAHSNITYKENEQNHFRELTLEGEGFFQIKKDTTHPFIVYANGLAVKVVGTAFNVKARTAITIVALESGKVQLLPAAKLKAGIQEAVVNMVPGQSVEYSPASNHFTQQTNTSLAVHTNWKKRTLVFEKTPLTTVASQVEEVYGVKLAFPERFQTYTFSATIPVKEKDKDVTILLELLSEAFQLEMYKDQDTIHFREAK